MGKDYFNNMPAGKEIDALIAEKVMKFTSDKQYGIIVWRVGDSDVFRPFHPSIDIKQAWEVVEKMQDKFSFILSRDDPPTDDLHKWYCELYAKEAPWQDYEVYAPTASLAICRVALLYAQSL